MINETTIVKDCRIGFNRVLEPEEKARIRNMVLTGIPIPTGFQFLEFNPKTGKSPMTLIIPAAEYETETIENFCGRLLGFCIACDLTLNGYLDVKDSTGEYMYMFDGLSRIIIRRDAGSDIQAKDDEVLNTLCDAITRISQDAKNLSLEQIRILYDVVGEELVRRVWESQNDD